jgi:hypothetical protein
MSNTQKHFRVFRRWFPIIAITMLVLQLALLWIQGALLNRQRAELEAMRSDIRNLASAINETLIGEDQSYDAPVNPAKMRPKRLWIEQALFAEEARIIDDLEKSRESAQDAVKKARDAQEKLSISENVRKAEEKAKIETEKKKWHRRLGLALLLAVLSFFAGTWLKNRK